MKRGKVWSREGRETVKHFFFVNDVQQRRGRRKINWNKGERKSRSRCSYTRGQCWDKLEGGRGPKRVGNEWEEP